VICLPDILISGSVMLASRLSAFALKRSNAAIYSRFVNVPTTFKAICPWSSVVINTFACRSTMTPLLTHVPDKYESKEGIVLPSYAPIRGGLCNPVFSTLGVA